MKQQPQQRRAVESVERILHATAELLASHGLEAVNTNRVAEQAGLTVPTVYRYFRNKHELLAALAERFTEREAGWMAALLESQDDDDLDRWVSALLEGYWANVRSYPAIVALRQAMRTLPELAAAEEASLASTTRLLLTSLAGRYPAVPERELALSARLVVETACNGIDRCHGLPAREARRRLAELRSMITAYLQQIEDR